MSDGCNNPWFGDRSTLVYDAYNTINIGGDTSMTIIKKTFIEVKDTNHNFTYYYNMQVVKRVTFYPHEIEGNWGCILYHDSTTDYFCSSEIAEQLKRALETY